MSKGHRILYIIEKTVSLTFFILRNKRQCSLINANCLYGASKSLKLFRTSENLKIITVQKVS